MTRTNVAPSVNPPAAPRLTAFSYTMASRAPHSACLLVSGVAELPAGGTYPDDVIRWGEAGPSALREKASYVAGEVSARITALGAEWKPSDRVRLYCPHPAVFEIGREVLGSAGVPLEQGLTWHDAAPPVIGLELEIDVLRHARELLLED